MKKLTAFWFACLVTLAFCLAAYAGQWTAHGYFYKPSMGASGQTEYNLFNQGLDQADAELFALDPPPPLSATAPLTYNSATGVLAIPRASATANGYLASADWSGFNAKEPAITPGATSRYWRGDKTWQLLDAGAVKIGEIWVGDPDYGSTIQAAITSINSILFSPPATLHIPAGTYTFPSSYTIPANITLAPENGAILSVPAGVTLTINGHFQAGPYQVFSYTGTGQGPQANNTGPWPLIFSRTAVEKFYPQWWGAVGDDVHADWLPLQQMVDCSIASGGIPMFTPGGIYKLTDTLKLCYGAPGYSSAFLFAGAGGIQGGNQVTAFDATSFGDRPAINIQGGRQVQLKGFRVFGMNVAPTTAAFEATGPDPNKANWITSGCVDSQYAPYSGICIDAYEAPTSTGGYPNDSYGRGSSSGTFLEDVVVQQFVVGLMLSPASAPEADDFFSARDCDIQYNTYGYSSGGSQSDSINLYNCWIERNWCSQITNAHGPQQGHMANMYGGGLQNAWKLFEGSSEGPYTIEGVWCEDFAWLGNFEIQVPVIFGGANFVADHFTLGMPGSVNYEPYFFTGSSPLKFDTCEFDAQNIQQNLNFINTGSTIFINCNFWDFIAGANGFIGLNTYGGMALMPTYQFINCNEQIAGDPYLPCINNEFPGGVPGAPPARQPIAPWTHTVRLWGFGGSTNYHVNLFAGTFQSPGLAFTGLSVTGTNNSAVLTFTAWNPPDWMVGDLIMWPVADRSGTITTQNNIPAFQVTAINGTTGVVTAQSLVKNVETAYAPGNLYTAVPLFINGSPATGNTHNNTTVDNVTNISNFAVGDWIQGAGIAGARIVNISGTTITLSRNAQSTANGVSIYNCGLTASDMTYPGAGVANSTGSAWGTSYTVGTAANDLVQLNGSGQLPGVSAANLTNFPILNQSTTGAAGSVTGETFPGSGLIVGTTDTQTLTNKSFGAGMTWPTFNQSTTGNAGSVTGLSVTAGKTLGVSNSLTLAGTDGTTLTFPGSSKTLMAADYSNAGTPPTWNQNTTGTAANLSGSQTANYIYAAPNGSAGAAAFRAMAAADVPTLNQNTTGNAATVTTVAVSQGGFGTTSALTPGATVSLNANNGTTFTLTPAQTETINASGGTAGQEIHMVITTSGTTSYTLTFGTNFHSAGTLATGTSTGKVFVITFVEVGGTFYEVCRTAAM